MFTNHADVVVTVEGAVYIYRVFPFTMEIIRHQVDEIQVSVSERRIMPSRNLFAS